MGGSNSNVRDTGFDAAGIGVFTYGLDLFRSGETLGGVLTLLVGVAVIGIKYYLRRKG